MPIEPTTIDTYPEPVPLAEALTKCGEASRSHALRLCDLHPGDIFQFVNIRPAELLGQPDDYRRDIYLVIGDANQEKNRVFPEGYGYGIVLLEAAVPTHSEGSCRISNIRGTESTNHFPSQNHGPLRGEPVKVITRIKGGYHEGGTPPTSPVKEDCNLDSPYDPDYDD